MGWLTVTTLVILLISVLSPFFQIATSQTNFTATSIIPKFHPTRFHSIAMPPVLGNASLSWKLQPNGINIYRYYSSEPAPMGIADFGLGPNGPYVLTTNSWEGVVYLNSLSTNTTFVSFQLNVNLYYTYGGNSYDLWVQDVAFFDTHNDTLFFLNNIWNLTAPNANVTGVYGNGKIYFYSVSHTTFYAFLAWNYPGSPEVISFPTTFKLRVNVGTNSLGEPVIYFYYNDGFGWINYDTVTVSNAPRASNVYFMVNGFEYNGAGLYYDSELVMAGPGGGRTSYVYSANVGLQLFYWNGHNYQEVENAYDFGLDTGEKLYNANVYSAYFPSNGELLSVIKAGFGTLGQLWNQNSVEVVQVNSPIYSGYAKIYNFSIPFSDSSTVPGFNFTGGEFIQTLVPTMQYSILIYQNGNLEDEGYAPPTYGSIVVNAESFSVTPSQTFISLYEGVSTSLTLNIIGEGPIHFSVSSPISVTLAQSYEDLNGSGSNTLYITAPYQSGNFTIYIYVDFLNGYIIKVPVTVSVILPYFQVTFETNVIGAPLPSSPVLTLDFPNGTITTIPLSSLLTLKIPYGTTYSMQQTIGEGNERWSLPSPAQGKITSSTTISVTYYQQFLITFEFTMQGGSGYAPPNVTYTYFGQPTTVTAPSTVWVDANTQYRYQPILQGNNERWMDFSPIGEASSPGVINAYYYNEYYITVTSPVQLYAIVNGTEMQLTNGWYIQGTSVSVINQTYPVAQGERYVISSISPSVNFTVESPLTVKASIITQYYVKVNSEIPIHALVNGNNVTFNSNWYNAGSSVTIENLTYYPSPGVRYIINSISPNMTFKVNSPITVSVSVLKQFYITVNSPLRVYAIVNDTNESLISGWYNSHTTVEVENLTYYPEQGERYLMVYVTPANFTLLSPVNLTVKFLKQYYVNVISPIPVKALINGSEKILNSSWVNAGTSIQVINYTYYVNGKERLVPVYLPSEFTVNSSTTVKVKTVTQYLVIINGVSNWYNEGSTIVLNANVPFYMVGKFVGTYNVSPGSSIVVYEPIEETLVEHVNYFVVGLIAGIIVLTVVAVVIVLRK